MGKFLHVRYRLSLASNQSGRESIPSKDLVQVPVEVVFLNAGHLVATSTYMSKNSNPPFPLGKCPTRLMQTLSYGTIMTALSCIGHIVGLDLVYF